MFWSLFCSVSFVSVHNTAEFIDQTGQCAAAGVAQLCENESLLAVMTQLYFVSISVLGVNILLLSRTCDICVYKPYRHLLVYVCVIYTHARADPASVKADKCCFSCMYLFCYWGCSC